MRYSLLVVASMILSACSGSPTAPAPFLQTGSGPITFQLPSTVERIWVEVRSTVNSCHYFEVFVAQRLIKSDILGDCRVASGMSFAEIVTVIGPRVDIRGAHPNSTLDNNVHPFTWTVEEVR
jgi:hypothetical protein